MIMGCYGIGIGRTAQAAVEQNHDQDGIIWPVPLAPFLAAIVPVNAEEKAQRETAEKLYQEASLAGLEVLLDDRIDRLGVKLKDIDLIGLPFKVIIGPKGLADGKVEIKDRRTGQTEMVKIDKTTAFLSQVMGQAAPRLGSGPAGDRRQ
jgi:prolyl-tRNA synthetase